MTYKLMNEDLERQMVAVRQDVANGYFGLAKATKNYLIAALEEVDILLRLEGVKKEK